MSSKTKRVAFAVICAVLTVMMFGSIILYCMQDHRTPTELGHYWCKYRATKSIDDQLVNEMYIHGTEIKGVGNQLLPTARVSRVKKVDPKTTIVYVHCNVTDFPRLKSRMDPNWTTIEMGLVLKKTYWGWRADLKSPLITVDMF